MANRTTTKRAPGAGFYAALVIASIAATAPADAQVEKMGPVSATIANCGDRININLMILVCANAYKCDYAVGVNNYSGAPINYTLAVDAPQNYPIYTQGPHSSKNYEAVKVVQAPQAANGPPVKITLSCARGPATASAPAPASNR